MGCACVKSDVVIKNQKMSPDKVSETKKENNRNSQVNQNPSNNRNSQANQNPSNNNQRSNHRSSSNARNNHVGTIKMLNKFF